METIIDTVEAYTLEINDVTEHGIVSLIVELDTRVLVFFEDVDDPIPFDPYDLINLYGIVYVESV